VKKTLFAIVGLLTIGGGIAYAAIPGTDRRATGAIVRRVNVRFQAAPGSCR
jgi:hypothetical protein